MHGVRGVCTYIFLLVLISGFIFPAVVADQATNITDLTNSSVQVNETLILSEDTTVTTTITEAAPEPTITETVMLTAVTTEPTPDPNSAINNTLNETQTTLANFSQEITLENISPSDMTGITGAEPEPALSGARANPGQVSFITDASTGSQYVSDEVIVRYNPNKFQNARVMSAYTVDSNAKIGAQVEQDFTDEGLSGMQVVKLPASVSVDEAIAEYQKNPDVLYAEPNYRIYLIDSVESQPAGMLSEAGVTSTTPTDPYFTYQYYLHNTGQTLSGLGIAGTPDADIDAPEAWDISQGSSDVVIGVVDTGINYTHPDLAGKVWTNPGEIPNNGVDDDHNGYIDDYYGWNFVTGYNNSRTLDDWGHGTHVAGTIGAKTSNSVGVSGVSWNSKVMAEKIFQSGGSDSATSDAIKAIQYADAMGVTISSNSWGGGSYSQALKDAIDASPELFVCAAGNDATNNDITHQYPSGYDSPNIISVAASNLTDELAPFSNFGTVSVDIAAPGQWILNTVCANDGVRLDQCGYYYYSGTSMATPTVSGVAALVKSVNPRLTNKQIKNVILNNVDVKSSLSGKVNTSGRLNAYKSVLAAQRMAGADKFGVFRDGVWYLDYNGNGHWDAGDAIRVFGDPGDSHPVVGDWTGDGKDEFGVFRDGVWYLDYNGNGHWDAGDAIRVFGDPGDSHPITGTWI
jgi:thermitase